MNYYVQDISHSDKVIRNIVANLPVPIYSRGLSGTRLGSKNKQLSISRGFARSEEAEPYPEAFVRKIHPRTQLALHAPAKPARQSLLSLYAHEMKPSNSHFVTRQTGKEFAEQPKVVKRFGDNC